MKKTILKVPVLFVALLFSACGEDLLFDSRGGETTSLAQMETGNTQQEVPVAGEPDTEGTTPDQAIPPAEEPVIDGTIPAQEIPLAGAGVTDAAPFDWNVYQAEQAAWEQLALGKTGYTFTQTHSNSEPALYRDATIIVADNIPYEQASSGRNDWNALFFSTTISEIYQRFYMLGLGNKVGLEYYGLSSFLVKYDEQLHYPTYIQFNRITGTNYTVYISIEALGEPLPPTGEPDNGNTPEPPAGEPNNGNTPEPPTEEPDNGNTPPPAGEPDNEFWEIIIGGPKTVW